MFDDIMKNMYSYSKEELKSEIYKKGYEFFSELFFKHTGEFLGCVLSKFPQWQKQVDNLHKGYYELFLKLGSIVNTDDLYILRELFIAWCNEFKEYERINNCLHLDAENLELGTDH